MSDFDDKDFNPGQSGKETKLNLNILSVGVVVIIIVLSTLVGILWSLNTNSAPVQKEVNALETSNTSELNREVVIWNATIRDSVAEVLQVLSMQDLADKGAEASESEIKYAYYRMCNDIQGFYKDLSRKDKSPDERIDYLYTNWAESVEDIADSCKGATEESINVDAIDAKVGKSWSLFGSFFTGIEPYLEEPTSAGQN